MHATLRRSKRLWDALRRYGGAAEYLGQGFPESRTDSHPEPTTRFGVLRARGAGLSGRSTWGVIALTGACGVGLAGSSAVFAGVMPNSSRPALTPHQRSLGTLVAPPSAWRAQRPWRGHPHSSLAGGPRGHAATFSPIAKGDIVASLADGSVNEYTPAGTFVQTLISNANVPTGSAFDGAGNLYVTEFGGNDILKVDGQTGAVSVFSNDQILGDGTGFNSPESIAFGPGYTRMYVSDANRLGVGGGIHVIDTASGKGVGFYPLPSSVGSEGVGESDWLAFDQAGSLYMTNENAAQGVMKVDQATGDVVQPSFISNLPDIGYATSFDRNGDLWVSDTSSILEYDASGTLLRTITNPSFNTVFAAVFNPPFDTVYAGDLGNGNIYAYDLSGNLQQTFNLGSGIDGLSVAGTVITPPPVGEYAALGDSYSAGEGLAPYLPGSHTPSPNDQCDRSNSAYGPLFNADVLKEKLVFAACSGATTWDILHSHNGHNHLGYYPEPSQLSQLSAKDNVVTLTIGGDDAGFIDIAKACVWVDIYGVPEGMPGKGCSTTDTTLISGVDARLRELGGAHLGVKTSPPSVPVIPLETVLKEIHAKAPNAHVYILGYPKPFGNVFDSHGNCQVGMARVVHTRLSYPLKVSQPDANWIDRVVGRLNRKVDRATTAANTASGTVFATAIDPTPFFGHHRYCDQNNDVWLGRVFVKLKVSLAGNVTVEDMARSSAHPTTSGQNLGYEAALVAAFPNG